MVMPTELSQLAKLGWPFSVVPNLAHADAILRWPPENQFLDDALTLD